MGGRRAGTGSGAAGPAWWEYEGRHKACPYRRLRGGRERTTCMGVGGQVWGRALRDRLGGSTRAGTRPAPTGG